MHESFQQNFDTDLYFFLNLVVENKVRYLFIRFLPYLFSFNPLNLHLSKGLRDKVVDMIIRAQGFIWKTMFFTIKRCSGESSALPLEFLLLPLSQYVSVICFLGYILPFQYACTVCVLFSENV